MSDNPLRAELISLALRLAAGGIFAYASLRYMMSHIDPNRSVNEAAKQKASALLSRLGIDKNVELDEHEMRIATLLVPPEDCVHENIGGHDELWSEIHDRVILPLSLMGESKKGNSKLSRLISPPSGVLLYGPPGCGKTLLARAIARSANARFLNVDLSILTDKYYGESQKLTSALFSVAVKFQPTIIFIDEIDSFLRNRSTTDHESTAIMKAQFMTLWDGFASGNNEIIVLGATNRRGDVDDAILRRMPAQFNVPMPSWKSRQQILKSIMSGEDVAEMDYTRIAKDAEHFAGSDLREACRLAALIRVRKNLKSEKSHGSICEADLMEAVSKMKRDVVTRNSRSEVISEFSRYVEENYDSFVNASGAVANSSTSPSQSDGDSDGTPKEFTVPGLD